MAYKQSYGKQPPEVLEKEHAVVEGIDLPGHWNRMFGTRVITDYDLSTLDQITDLPGGESLGWCYQCAKCVARANNNIPLGQGEFFDLGTLANAVVKISPADNKAVVQTKAPDHPFWAKMRDATVPGSAPSTPKPLN